MSFLREKSRQCPGDWHEDFIHCAKFGLTWINQLISLPPFSPTPLYSRSAGCVLEAWAPTRRLTTPPTPCPILLRLNPLGQGAGLSTRAVHTGPLSARLLPSRPEPRSWGLPAKVSWLLARRRSSVGWSLSGFQSCCAVATKSDAAHGTWRLPDVAGLRESTYLRLPQSWGRPRRSVLGARTRLLF